MAFTVSNFLKCKNNGEKITMLTAYDYSTAKLFNDEKIETVAELRKKWLEIKNMEKSHDSNTKKN